MHEENILNHNIISERYFFPRFESFENPFWVDCGDVKLACYYHEKDHNAKTFVHFHGNGEIVADYLDNLVFRIADMGYNCFLVEYRGYGMSSGKSQAAKILRDVEKVIKAIPAEVENMIVFGRSVGSLFATHAVDLFPQVPALIIESGIANPLERLLLRMHPYELGISPEELQDAVHTHFNQQQKMHNYRGKTLVLHARNDNLVVVNHGEKLFEWANEPKELKIFERGDHNNISWVNEKEYFETIANFLQEI
ncbi:alpha/beta hydrolase [Candidatus Riflebacteria bacterium]